MSRIVITCANCGSADVRRDAFAAWNVEAQDWEIASVYDEGHCEDCEGEARLIEVPHGDCRPISGWERAARAAGFVQSDAMAYVIGKAEALDAGNYDATFSTWGAACRSIGIMKPMAAPEPAWGVMVNVDDKPAGLIGFAGGAFCFSSEAEAAAWIAASRPGAAYIPHRKPA